MTLNKSGSTARALLCLQSYNTPCQPAPHRWGGHRTQPCDRAVFIAQKINQRQAVNTTLSPTLNLFIVCCSSFWARARGTWARPTPESILLTPSVEFKKTKTNICPRQVGEKHLLMTSPINISGMTAVFPHVPSSTQNHRMSFGGGSGRGGLIQISWFPKWHADIMFLFRYLLYL